jgi:predicted membrane protein DUF2232
MNRWRLILGTIGYVLWAPLALVGLPFVALIGVAGARTRSGWVAAYVVGLVSIAVLVSSRGLLGSFVAAFTVFVTAAFLGGVLLGTAPVTVLRQAFRATFVGGVATALLARAMWGETWWHSLQWEAVRESRVAVGYIVALLPEAAPALDRAIAFTSGTLPGVLVLQAVAGIALAWQWHSRVSERPLGEPLTAFQQFRFSGQWVWGLGVMVAIWMVPRLSEFKAVAVNLAVVLGTMYLLRGAAIATAFATAAGITAAALIAGTVLAAVLFVPLLFLIPGLWTLGVTDTWLQFRRRLETVDGRPNAT